MNNEENYFLEGALLLSILVILMLFLFTFVILARNYDQKYECNRYSEEYNYQTELVNLGFFHGGKICYIKTTGGKVRLNDFNMASVVQPLKK